MTRRFLHSFFPLLLFTYTALLPLVLLGDYQYRIHDFLERLGPLIALIDSGAFFELDPLAPVPELLDGMPRGFLPSPLFLKNLIFYAFGAEWGLALNNLFVRLLGFLGMYFLLSHRLMPGDRNKGLHLLIAGVFCSLPIFSLYGLSVLGYPFLVSAFIDLYRKEGNWRSFLFIGIFCCYSSLFHVGVFAILILILFQGYLLLSNKQLHRPVLLGILFMIALYGIVEYMTVYNFFSSHEATISHRTERVIDPSINWKGLIGLSFERLLEGNYHAGKYPGGVIYGIGLLTLLYARFRKKMAWGRLKTLSGLILFSCILAFLPHFVTWRGWDFLYDRFDILRMFDFRRFDFLLSFIAPLTLAYSLKFWCDHFPRLRTPLILSGGLLFLLLNVQLDRNMRSDAIEAGISLEEYLSKDLMERIEKELKIEKEHKPVIHIGIDPSVSQCNGIPTLDGYFNNYPLRYKKKFERIIQPSLDSPKLRRYFEDWGNECIVLFDKERVDGGKLKIDLNIEAFERLGGRYVLSYYELKAPRRTGLRPVEVYKSQKSPWSPVYVYEPIG